MADLRCVGDPVEVPLSTLYATMRSQVTKNTWKSRAGGAVLKHCPKNVHLGTLSEGVGKVLALTIFEFSSVHL